MARGEPHARLDGVRKLVESPRRWFTKEAPPASYAPKEATETAVVDYLRDNGLSDVQVELHRYDPATRWRRLQANRRMSPAWRYSVGTLSWLAYTALPGRAFGRTDYDPFSNTLQVNTDDVVRALSEAAVAKDVRNQRLPGTYATLTQLPGASLVRQSRAAGDVVGYARAKDNWELERRSMEELYPGVGAEALTMAIPTADMVSGIALGAGGSLAGSGIAQHQIDRRERERLGQDVDEVMSRHLATLRTEKNSSP